MSNTRLFVARIARDCRARDLEDLFGRYGRLRDVVVKVGYAFVVRPDLRIAAYMAPDILFPCTLPHSSASPLYTTNR